MEIFKVQSFPKTMVFLFRNCSALIVLLASMTTYAQVEMSFTPLERYSGRSKDMMERLSNLLESEYINLGAVPNTMGARWVCDTRANHLKRIARLKLFINNGKIERLLDETVERIVSANKLLKRDRMVLILNNPEVNAYCYGRGLFIVTVGLLGKLHNEDELAYILSHEIAHDELRHVQENIIAKSDTKIGREANLLSRKVYSGTATAEELAAYKKIVYGMTAYKKEKEFDADSVGYVYYRKAGYNPREAITSLISLDSAYTTTHSTEELFSPLTFPKFQFREYWLKPRLTVFGSMQPDSIDSYPDSLASHPKTEFRTERLQKYIGTDSSHTRTVDTQFMKEIVAISQFQRVESAYQTKKYDKGLFQILILLNQYPSNSFLVSRGAKILFDLAVAKNENLTNQYAARYLIEYSEELRTVNSFIYNINREESAELAFNLLNNKDNFNKEDPAHYYLLWRVCELTRREQTKRSVEDAYLKKFNKSVSSYEYQ